MKVGCCCWAAAILCWVKPVNAGVVALYLGVCCCGAGTLFVDKLQENVFNPFSIAKFKRAKEIENTNFVAK